MEVADRMGPILGSCQWAGGMDDLLRVVPELAEELPPMERVPGSLVRGNAIPLPGASAVLAGVASFLCGVLEDPDSVDNLVDAREASVRDDPVVHALVAMWRDADRPGSRVLVLPALAAAWSLSGLVGGEPDLVAHLPGPLASRCVDRTRQLHEANAAEAAVLEARLAARLAARVGAAITLARSSGVPVPAGGIVRRLLTNPLVSLYRMDRLDPEANFVHVCRILRSPMDPAMVEMLFAAGKLAWSAVNQRLAGRKPRPVDRLIGAISVPGDSSSVLLDPELSPALIRCLADLIDARSLRSHGFDSRHAKRLLTDQALRPLSAAWGDVVGSLRTWTVLSAVVDRIAPLWSGMEGDEEVTEPIAISARWSLRVPSGLGLRQDHAIVAVRFADLVDITQPNPDRARAILRRVTASVVSGFPDGLWTWMGDYGLAAFPTAGTAIRFGEAIRSTIPGPEGILEDTVNGSPLVVRPGLQLSIGMDWGRVDGGTDGATTWLEGPAVSGAIELTGGGAPTMSMHDPLEIRSATSEHAGLRSQGVIATPSFVAAIERGLSSEVHRFGEDTEAAGVSVDFRLYPVSSWWERDGTVRMWVEMGDRRRGGPAELICLNRLMFRDIHRRDQGATGLAPLVESEPEPQLDFVDDETDVSISSSKEAPEWDPFLSGDRPVKRKRSVDDLWTSLSEEPDVEVDG
jgi:hypothetical protein